MIKFFKKVVSRSRLRRLFSAKKTSIPKITNTRFEAEEVSLTLKVPKGDSTVLKKVKNIVLNDPWCVPAQGVEMELAQEKANETAVIVTFTTLNKAAMIMLEKKIYTSLSAPCFLFLVPCLML